VYEISFVADPSGLADYSWLVLCRPVQYLLYPRIHWQWSGNETSMAPPLKKCVPTPMQVLEHQQDDDYIDDHNDDLTDLMQDD